MPSIQLFRSIRDMENHPSTSSHCYHQSLSISNNFHLDHCHPQLERHEEKPSRLPIFDSTTHVPSDDTMRFNQPHNNLKRKRSRFLKIGGNSLKITSPASSSFSGVSKPKITKKPPDPSAPKITRPCTECGKKFWSWKALFGHMRCHPERQWRGINPPPNFRPGHNNNVDSPNSGSEFIPRKKHKSSISSATVTDEDHEVAACLLLLANGTKPDDIVNNAEPVDDVVRDKNIVDIAASEPCSSSGRFECSGCKKVFGSHQALGGHRASHKNVKGCFASTSVSGSGLTQAVNTNLDLNFPPPITLMSGEDQYDSSSSYSSAYSGSALDLRLRL